MSLFFRDVPQIGHFFMESYQCPYWPNIFYRNALQAELIRFCIRIIPAEAFFPIRMFDLHIGNFALPLLIRHSSPCLLQKLSALATLENYESNFSGGFSKTPVFPLFIVKELSIIVGKINFVQQRLNAKSLQLTILLYITGLLFLPLQRNYIQLALHAETAASYSNIWSATRKWI